MTWIERTAVGARGADPQRAGGVGGVAAQLADIEEVAAFHGDAHELLVYRFFKKDRPALFELAARLRLKAASSDGQAHRRRHRPGAVHGAQPAHQPEGAERRDRGRGQRLR